VVHLEANTDQSHTTVVDFAVESVSGGCPLLLVVAVKVELSFRHAAGQRRTRVAHIDCGGRPVKHKWPINTLEWDYIKEKCLYYNFIITVETVIMG
jgi:hypothetical protein